MFDTLHIVDTLRAAGFVAGSVEVNAEPGLRDVTITDAPRDEDGRYSLYVATDAARVLANAGYDILCYGRGLNNPSALATLLIALPKGGIKAA